MQKFILISLLCSCTYVHYRIGSTLIELNEDEKEFIDNFFFHLIDLDKVEIKNAGKDDNEGRNYTVGNVIYFNRNLDYQNNQEKYRHVLVHEFTHVFQYQYNLKDNNIEGYHYHVSSSISFFDLGTEQQAALIEDYYQWTLENNSTCARNLDCPIYGLDAILSTVQETYEEILNVTIQE